MSEGVVVGSLPPGEGEEWTTSEVAASTGMDRSNVRRWARGKRIDPVGAMPDRGRELRWPAAAVWEAWRQGGRGNRTSGEARSASARRGWVTRRGEPLA
jgi:hypothetical protein